MQDPAPTAGQPEPSATPPAPFNMQTHLAWIRTRMALERTLMSWNRTSLSLISFGFTIYQFFDKFQTAAFGPDAPHPRAPLALGLALILAGILGTAIVLYQYHTMVRYLQGEPFRTNAAQEGMPRWSLLVALTTFLGLVGVGALVWILLGG